MDNQAEMMDDFFRQRMMKQLDLARPTWPTAFANQTDLKNYANTVSRQPGMAAIELATLRRRTLDGMLVIGKLLANAEAELEADWVPGER